MQPITVYDTNILLLGVGWRGSPHRRQLLPLGSYQGILIVTAADFLAQCT